MRLCFSVIGDDCNLMVSSFCINSGENAARPALHAGRRAQDNKIRAGFRRDSPTVGQVRLEHHCARRKDVIIRVDSDRIEPSRQLTNRARMYDHVSPLPSGFQDHLERLFLDDVAAQALPKLYSCVMPKEPGARVAGVKTIIFSTGSDSKKDAMALQRQGQLLQRADRG